MEIEAKFSIPDEDTFQRLLRAGDLGGYRLGKGSVADLHDRYLDTSGLAILARGYACRLRRQGERYLATVKGLGEVAGAIHRRVEYETALSGPLSPSDWPPGNARDLVQGICGDEPLVPLFAVKQSRHSRSLYAAGRAMAELSLDRGRIVLENDHQQTVPFLELEAEVLAERDQDLLERLALDLQETWGLVPQIQSKFERGLALSHLAQGPVVPGAGAKGGSLIVQVQPGPLELLDRPGIEPDDPMSEAGRKTFRFHYQRMVHHEPGTRLGEDIGALHDMRVATRRMRAAFRVFGDYYRPKVVAPLLKGLKRTGRALGPVRDLDVFREKIQAYLAAMPEAERDGLDGFLSVLDRRREAARGRMIAYLDGDKYARFKERFGEFVETVGLGSRPTDLRGAAPQLYRVRNVAPVAIYERLAAVHAYDERVNMSSPPLERLHSLRIACKGLRYCLEFFREVLGADTRSLIKEVVYMQDHLGALQDAVVARSILSDYLRWGTWDQEDAETRHGQIGPVSDPGVEAYLAAKEAELYHLVDSFPQVWQRLQGAEFSRKVAAAVVVL